MRRASAEGAERPGVRQARRALVHRSRQAPRPRHGCRRVLLHQARTPGRSSKACSACCPPTASDCRRTKTRSMSRRRRRRGCGHSTSSAPGEVKPRDVIYRGERGKPIAGLGGYQMFDSLAVEASGNVCVATLISGCISVIAPDGAHRRAGADRRPRHHQHRLRRARTEDRLHHAVGQGRTDRDGLGAARPAAEFSEQVTTIPAIVSCERSDAMQTTSEADCFVACAPRRRLAVRRRSSECPGLNRYAERPARAARALVA